MTRRCWVAQVGSKMMSSRATGARQLLRAAPPHLAVRVSWRLGSSRCAGCRRLIRNRIDCHLAADLPRLLGQPTRKALEELGELLPGPWHCALWLGGRNITLADNLATVGRLPSPFGGDQLWAFPA